ncbi:MAG: response regulator transcription factor [Burkholderiales bacterium]|nr:response regulator transcription factor [Burkholderiales bacterium]
MRILIVEDDATIAANLYDYLEARGHSIDAAADGLSGLHLARKQSFDVIVLDLGLPGMDGLSMARTLREQAQIETPILMLTARDTLDDKLTGFAHGADDYLVKPFSLKEVEARITALHKRSSGRTTPRALAHGELSLDPKTMVVRWSGAEVRLPPKCLAILELLLREPTRVISRDEIERQVWGEPQETSDTLRSHLHTLRRTLTAAGGSDPVETLHGIGYRLRKPGT